VFWSFFNNSVVARAQWAFSVSQGSVETLLRWGGKRLYDFAANLLRKPCTKFYQNRLSFIEYISGVASLVSASPYIFLPKKLTTFFKISVIACGKWYLSSPHYPIFPRRLSILFSVLSKFDHKKFTRVSTPGECHPGRSASPSPPSDATGRYYKNNLVYFFRTRCIINLRRLS